MPNYTINILFADSTDPLTVELNEFELDRAEEVAADLRFQVEQAKEVNAPVIQFSRPEVGELTLEPGNIISIDLEETPAG